MRKAEEKTEMRGRRDRRLGAHHDDTKRQPSIGRR